MLFRSIVDMAFGLGLFVNAMLFVPQIIKLWRSKSAEGVSLLTFGGFNLIQIPAILHGYFVADYILLVGFVLSFITCGSVTALATLYRFRFKRSARNISPIST